MALEEILAWKRYEVAQRRAADGLGSVLSRCVPSDRSFREAIRHDAPAFILEMKHASPSAGNLIAGSRRLHVLEAYAPHADAISVVTDKRFFGGSLEHLTLVRDRVSAPILCKDFVLDPIQVAEARLHGADAILLILAVLEDDTWRKCAALAERLDMAVLTEVHDEVEVRRAVDLGAEIIGINSRDLNTFHIDLGVVSRLAPLVPSDKLIVAESGLQSRSDVVALRPHAHAFLVGTSLLRDPEPERAVRRLVYGLTKVCGLNTPEDARAAWEAGATHGGLVFVPCSPRFLSDERASAVRNAIPLKWVGVFADEGASRVSDMARALELDAVQLHGEESPRDVSILRGMLPSACELWKAVRIRDRIPRARRVGADRILLDAWVPGRRGGTGHVFDWRLLDAYPDRSRAILAGGLNLDNVPQAAATGVAGLDVSSGVEVTPGRKDPALLRRFMLARRRLPGRGGVSA